MEAILKRFIRFWSRRNKYAVFSWLTGFFAVIVFLIYQLPFEQKHIYDIIVNILASFMGFILSLILLYLLTLILSHYEDEQKVCYDDHILKKQYEKSGYLKSFSIHSSDEFKPTPKVFEDLPDLEKMSECNLIDIVSHKLQYWIQTAFHSIGNLRANDTDIDKARVYVDILFDSTDKLDRMTVIDYPELKDQFQLDSFIKHNSLEIISAHSQSQIEHSLTVRLQDLKVCKEGINIVTHRSTYIANLLTNRAIDYKIRGELSLRELFENRPKLTPLNVSKMSNHIGVNVLVFLEDGKYLLLPKRDNRGSIAKNMLTASWATRLTMDNYSKKLNEHYLKKGLITQNIGDFAKALKVHKSFFDGKVISPELIGASRDIYEGGKPTFFYLVNLKDVKAIDYLREVYHYSKNPPKDVNMDNSEFVMVALWDTLRMNQDIVGLNNIVLKKDARLTFYTPMHHKFDVEWRRVSYPCEKNLIAAFYFLGIYKQKKLRHKTGIPRRR